MKINFFIVGMARAATTSLWKYLKLHPEIFMSEVKEPHHFDRDILHSQDILATYRNRGNHRPRLKRTRNENTKVGKAI